MAKTINVDEMSITDLKGKLDAWKKSSPSVYKRALASMAARRKARHEREGAPKRKVKAKARKR